MQGNQTPEAHPRRADYKARKRGIRHPFRLAVCLCALLSAIGSVGLGLLLKGKLPEDLLLWEDPVIESESGEEAGPAEGVLRPVRGALLNLADYTSVEGLSRAASALKEKTDTVSLCLRGLDGTLYYPSEVAQAFALQEGDPPYLNLARAVEVLHEAGFYVVGYLDLVGFAAAAAGSPYVQQAKIACDAALVSEAAAAGFDELVLCGGTEAMTWSDELCAIGESVRAQQARDAQKGLPSGNTLLSLAITPGVLFSDEAALYVNRWLRVYDATVLDLRNYSGLIGDQVQMWTYWLTRYQMRLLLPAGEGADAEAKGHDSWLEAVA